MFRWYSGRDWITITAGDIPLCTLHGGTALSVPFWRIVLRDHSGGQSKGLFHWIILKDPYTNLNKSSMTSQTLPTRVTVYQATARHVPLCHNAPCSTMLHTSLNANALHTSLNVTVLYYAIAFHACVVVIV